jgi:hypothetical protein
MISITDDVRFSTASMTACRLSPDMSRAFSRVHSGDSIQGEKYRAQGKHLVGVCRLLLNRTGRLWWGADIGSCIDPRRRSHHDGIGAIEPTASEP